MSNYIENKEEIYQEIRSILAEQLSIKESEVPENLVLQSYDAFFLEQNLDSEESTIIEQIESHCIAKPESTALTYGNVSVTYNSLYEGMNQVAMGLANMNVSPGTRIGVYMKDPIQRIYAILGVMRVNGIAFVIDPLETVPQINRQLDSADIKLVVSEKYLISQQELGLDKLLIVDNLKNSLNMKLPEYPVGKDSAYISITSEKENVWTHLELIDRIASFQSSFGLEKSETFAMYNFDIDDTCFWYQLWPFTIGAKLMIIEQTGAYQR